MKIAIIGTGISGLTAAYYLHPCHELTIFEANDYVGGHSNTMDVEWQGERHAIDTGFIVFNDWTYPRFGRLLTELKVPSQPTSMSFSVHDEVSGLEYNGHSLATLFAQRRNLLRPEIYRMLGDILRFNRHARRLPTDDARGAGPTVREFLQEHGYSREFCEYYLLPMGSAIWSCPRRRFGEFPLQFVVQFFDNHGLLNLLRRPRWRVVCGGSRTYVEAISRGFRSRIRLQTPVERVQRLPDRVLVVPRGQSAESFDHVIFSCHSDQALRILGDGATPQEREVLAAFPYQENSVVLHTDSTLLPRCRRAWASWNCRLYADAGAPPSVTYNMNILQGLRSRHTFCVTLNDEDRIAPDRVLWRCVYHHPVFTRRRAAAQARHRDLLCANRTSFCGAYWRNGFHEDGVVSAEAVVRAIQALSAGGTAPVCASSLAQPQSFGIAAAAANGGNA